MKVIKQYKLTLYHDGYMTDKKSERNIKAIEYFSTKPTESDIEDIINTQIYLGHEPNLRGLNIEVKKEYRIEI